MSSWWAVLQPPSLLTLQDLIHRKLVFTSFSHRCHSCHCSTKVTQNCFKKEDMSKSLLVNLSLGEKNMMAVNEQTVGNIRNVSVTVENLKNYFEGMLSD